MADETGIFDGVNPDDNAVETGEGSDAALAGSHGAGSTESVPPAAGSDLELPVLVVEPLVADDDVGPPVPGDAESSSALPSSTTERVEVMGAVSSGSRQTSLAHWLL